MMLPQLIALQIHHMQPGLAKCRYKRGHDGEFEDVTAVSSQATNKQRYVGPQALLEGSYIVLLVVCLWSFTSSPFYLCL